MIVVLSESIDKQMDKLCLCLNVKIKKGVNHILR